MFCFVLRANKVRYQENVLIFAYTELAPHVECYFKKMLVSLELLVRNSSRLKGLCLSSLHLKCITFCVLT